MKTIKNIPKKSAFLIKTYDMLQNPIYSDIIEWHHDGFGFVINNITKFTDILLPIYFKHSNIASFIRQLNMYGFSKKRAISNENYYYHPKFQRNQKHLIYEIQRKMQKKISKNIQIQRNKQNTQDNKICSQLSIQLQNKQQISKKQYPPYQNIQNKVQNDLMTLQNTNIKLIDYQFKALIEIFKDLNNSTILSTQNTQIMQCKVILSDYIQTQLAVHTQLRHKIDKYIKQHNKQGQFQSNKILTQQHIKQKKQTQQTIHQNHNNIY